VTGLEDLGAGFPPRARLRIKSREPGVWEELVAAMAKRHCLGRIQIGAWMTRSKPASTAGWSDGLPVVPPTEAASCALLEHIESRRVIDACRPIRTGHRREGRDQRRLAGCKPDTCRSLSCRA